MPLWRRPLKHGGLHDRKLHFLKQMDLLVRFRSRGRGVLGQPDVAEWHLLILGHVAQGCGVLCNIWRAITRQIRRRMLQCKKSKCHFFHCSKEKPGEVEARDPVSDYLSLWKCKQIWVCLRAKGCDQKIRLDGNITAPVPRSCCSFLAEGASSLAIFSVAPNILSSHRVGSPHLSK